MEPNQQEREIDLVQLILSVFKKVKIIVIAGIICAVLIGGYKMLPGFKNISSEAVKNQLESDYQYGLSVYNDQVTQFEKEIGNIEEEIDRQTEYKDNSILLKLNPYDVQIATTQYFVDAGYQIITGQVYQNRDLTNTILSAYYNIAQKGEMYQFICDNADSEISVRYLTEIVTTEVNYDLGTLTIQVLHDDEDACANIMSLIKSYLKSRVNSLKSAIGEHKFLVLNSSQASSVNFVCSEPQRVFKENLKVLEDSLTAKKAELTALVVPVKAAPPSVGSVLKSGLKWFIIGGILGGFLACAFYLVKFMTDSTIKTEKDITLFLNLPVIGNIPVAEGKKEAVNIGKKGKNKRLNQYKMADEK